MFFSFCVPNVLPDAKMAMQPSGNYQRCEGSTDYKNNSREEGLNLRVIINGARVAPTTKIIPTKKAASMKEKELRERALFVLQKKRPFRDASLRSSHQLLVVVD